MCVHGCMDIAITTWLFSFHPITYEVDTARHSYTLHFEVSYV